MVADDLPLDQSGRLALPEGKTLECKRDLSSPDSVLESVVAFANSAGGRLVIGVADDGEVVGVADPLLEEERLTNLISDSIRPQLRPTVELAPLAGKTVLIAKVWLGQQRPYHLKRQGPHQGSYIRVGSSDRLAGAAMVAELRRSAEGVSFDQLPAPRAKLSDLDRPLLAGLLGREVDESALRTLRLIVQDQGEWVPSHGGLLVGCAQPEMFLPHAWVQCARFRGARKRDIIDKANIRGPLPLAVDAVMAFFRRHAFLSSKFGESPRRQDVWSLPFAALQELVVNALVHSSYDDHGTPIKIAFRDQAITIESPGGLVPGLTVEDMIEGTSIIRNPVLARVFEELGHIEQWGSGIPEVLQDLAEAGLPPLDIEERRERLRLTIRIPSHDPARFEPAWRSRPSEDAGRSQVEPDRPPVSQQVSPKRPQVSPDLEQVRADLGRHGTTILSALADGPLSRAETLAAIGVKNEYRSYQRHIVPLINRGLVGMTNPDNPTAHTQTYALTGPGRSVLTAIAGVAAANDAAPSGADRPASPRLGLAPGPRPARE
ncbi:MAG: putative DNA binding domain-containing protein [Propionibacteriaceae bacterium]|jgi:predicted HTH transcriptional regulator|nr:putative DNA binding domain-containing protein [Propionibacteriaceae bacterium]